MKSRVKIIVFSLVCLMVVLGGVLMFLSQPQAGSIARLIPYLEKRKPTDQSETLTSIQSARAGSFTSKMHTATYLIDEKYEAVRNRIKNDLKGRITSQKDYSTNGLIFTMMNVMTPNPNERFSVTVRNNYDKKTKVGFIVKLPLNPVGKAKLWD